MKTGIGGSIHNSLTESLKNTCTHTHISIIDIIKDFISASLIQNWMENKTLYQGKIKIPRSDSCNIACLLFNFSDSFANVG